MLDDVDPGRDLVEELPPAVPPVMSECPVVGAEERRGGGDGDQHRDAGAGDRPKRLVDEGVGVVDVFEHVEDEHEFVLAVGPVSCADLSGTRRIQVVVVVVDVPADRRGVFGERRCERVGEPPVTGSDVQHPTCVQGAVVVEDAEVGLEPLDLPGVAGRAGATFGQVHRLEATVRTGAAARAPTDPMTAPSPDSNEPARWVRWTVRALVIVPIVVASARAVATGWFPVGDSALLAIRATDVGTSHHPLLGSWTSASLTLGTDVNNPGPLYADLLAPFMWTFGRWFDTGTGVAIGVGAVNAGFAGVTAWVGSRLGGWRVERWTLVMVAGLTWSMGSELLIDIWQPHALLIPFTCLLTLTVALLAGRWTMLPAWLAVASLIVQTHIGYVYVLVVLGLLVAGFGIAAWRSSRPTARELLADHTLRWSVAVVALAWLQPVIEQLFGEGRGNLARLATNAGGGDVTMGAATSVKLVAAVVALPPWWTRFGFEDTVESTPLTLGPDGPELRVAGLPSGPVALLGLVVLVGVLAGLLVALRRRDIGVAADAVLVALVGVVTAVATLTIQTVSVVGLGSHHVRWLWALSVFAWTTVVWSAVELGAGRLVDRHVNLALVAVVALFGLGNLTYTAHDLGPTADRAAADTLERTFDDLTDFRPEGSVRYAVDDLRPFEAWSSAVQMRLRELGVEFRVDDEGVVRQLGDRRRADGTEVTTVRQIERGAAVRYSGPACVISRASPFDPETEAEIDELIDAAADDLAAGRVGLDLTDLPEELVASFERAVAGDADEAFVLVADGLLPFLAVEGRIVSSTPAVEAAVADTERIDRRVVGTLVIVTDPPVGCG